MLWFTCHYWQTGADPHRRSMGCLACCHLGQAWDSGSGFGIWVFKIFKGQNFLFWQPIVHILFLKHQYRLRRLQRLHTRPYEHTHANPAPMHAFERLGRLDLEIDKITIDASLSMGTPVPNLAVEPGWVGYSSTPNNLISCTSLSSQPKVHIHTTSVPANI